MARAVAAIFALLLLATVGTFGIQAALENAGENEIVVNETWTPNAGNVTVLDESERTGAYYSNETTVFDENDTVMERGTDYEWLTGNGTIKAVVGGGLDGDSDAKITYRYQQTTSEQRALTSTLALLPQVLGLLAPVFLFVLFLMLVRG
jgi:hypothetical protein